MWLGTRTGIVKLNPARTFVTIFDENYGFYDRESVYFGSCLKSRDGQLYFGGIDGHYHFYPEQLIAVQASQPNLIFSSFIVAGQSPTDVALEPRKKPINEIKKINLSHKQSTFSFGFIALDYASPEKTQYFYKLDRYITAQGISASRMLH